jgi:hypothetical protein
MAARASAAGPVRSALEVVAATTTEQLQAVAQDVPPRSVEPEPSATPEPSADSPPEGPPTQTAQTIPEAAPHAPSTTSEGAAGASAGTGANPRPNGPQGLGPAGAAHLTQIVNSLARSSPGKDATAATGREPAAALRPYRRLLASPAVAKLGGAAQSAGREIAALTEPTGSLGRAQAALQVLAQTGRALAELAAVGLGATQDLVRPPSAVGPSPWIENRAQPTRAASGPKVSLLGVGPVTATPTRQAPRTAQQAPAERASADAPAPIASAKAGPTSNFGGARRAAHAAAAGVPLAAGAVRGAQSASTPRGAQAAGQSPARPAPARGPEPPSPQGISSATATGTGSSTPIFLMLTGLLLLAVPRRKRRLRLASEPWRVARFELIPERPG